MTQHPLRISKHKHQLLRLIVAKYIFNRQKMLLILKGEFRQVSFISLRMIHGSDEMGYIRDRGLEQ